ncbi:hypothetical protein ACFPPD_10085 [Cohnella suwonensis]|uniref:Uncharacterized protein n=1 Tax=Cohnella suwonensis TaxID=696072 RepID=A0ABW0LW44_9BACL
METYDLAELSIAQGPQTWLLVFSRARLFVVSEAGTRLWYIDIDGLTDDRLLADFAESHAIDVGMTAVSIGGKTFRGNGYFHPNPLHRAAALRGEGALEGYSHP